MVSATEALQRLERGNRRYIGHAGDRDEPVDRSHRPWLYTQQRPFAIVLACSDSRVPVELIFDQGFGDLFVIRVAGNIAAPSQIGSVEFAATEFDTRLVVVLGHSNCGAIIATLNSLGREETHHSPNLRAIVDRVRPAVEPVIARHGDYESEAAVRDAVRANVRAGVDALAHGSLVLEELIGNGKLTVVGAEYDIATGTVEFFEETTG